MNLLTPFGIAYGWIMDVRNRLYDRGVLSSHSLGARTVSIGNLTTGGTGKTPLVALTAAILAESGENVCVLTRGYGRTTESDRVLVSDGQSVLADAATGGDEPVELARKLVEKAVVIADADRVGAAKWAKERFGITAFVLDDGFQHRRAERDLDIVCIDATDPYGSGRVLPAGQLRESRTGLARADIVVITRADLVESADALKADITSLCPAATIFRASTRISRVTALSESLPIHQTDQQVPDSPSLAFSGLGNPASFRHQLESANFQVAAFSRFADHHRYSQNDLDELCEQARAVSAGSLLTTAKDAVKLKGLQTAIPVFVIEIEVVLDDAEEFRRLVIG